MFGWFGWCLVCVGMGRVLGVGWCGGGLVVGWGGLVLSGDDCDSY